MTAHLSRFTTKPTINGFSLIELLMVISLIILLAAAGSPLVSNMMISVQHTTAMDRILGSLRKAQQFSMSQDSGSGWGVCLVNQRIVRTYQGNCNSPAQSEEYELPKSVSVSGLNDISFSTLRGLPSAAAVITVSSTQQNQIEVTLAGGTGVKK